MRAFRNGSEAGDDRGGFMLSLREEGTAAANEDEAWDKDRCDYLLADFLVGSRTANSPRDAPCQA
jgi:hypothetical protein